MIPIIRAGLRDRRVTIAGWTWGISVYIAINILVYGSIRDQAAAINKALNNLPPTAQALFGSAGDFLSPVGYLSSKLYYLILPLLFTLLAVTLSTSLLSREEEDGTLELLLARPISRSKLLLSKLLTALAISTIVGTITLIVTLVCLNVVNYDINFSYAAQAMAMTLLLSLIFGSIAWMLVGIGRFGRRASVGLACAVALASYLTTSLEKLVDWLKWPAKLLPYHYYTPSDILEGRYNWWNALGMLIAIVILLTIAHLGFRRRDLS